MTEHDPSSAQSRPRNFRRRLLKVALYLGIGLVVLVGLGAVLLSILLSEDNLKRMISERGRAALKREVSVGSVDLDLFSGVKLGDVRVANKEGFSQNEFIHVKEVDVRVEVWPLIFGLFKRVHVRATVTEPTLRIERNAAGELNIADLLAPKEEKEEMAPLDELSLSFKLSGGRIVFQDDATEVGRETALTGLEVTAEQAAIDQPLSYRVTGSVGKGALEMEGRPVLFHEGVVDPRYFRGELLKVTLSRFPADALCAHLGLPAALDSMEGGLVVTAEDEGQIRAHGDLTASGPFEGVGVDLTLDSTADAKTLDVSANVACEVRPFSRATFDLDIKGGGAEGLRAVLRFDADLAKLTSGEAAKAFSMPLTADGTPATSHGEITGRLEATGKLREIKSTLAVSIKKLQAHPSLTGNVAHPPEDGALTAEATVRLTPEQGLDEVLIPSLTAKSSFLDAEISNGRITSLSDPKGLTSDLSGHVRFSGRAFSSKFGKALGLPEISDNLNVTFSAKGEAGRARIAVSAGLEREEGAPEPVTVAAALSIEAQDGKLNAEHVKIEMRAGKGDGQYAGGTLSGAVKDFLGAPDADLTFAGSADLAALAARLSAYAGILGELKPGGRIALTGGTLRGTSNALKAGFKVGVENLTIAGRSDKLPDIPEELLDILAEQTFLCECKIGADVPKQQVELEALDFKSDLLSGRITGKITDWEALKGSVDVSLRAKTDIVGPVLAALKRVPEGVDTRGSLEFVGAVSTETGRAELKTLKLTTPYLNLAMKEPATLSGLDVNKFLASPVEAAASLSGDLSIEGTVLLDSLAKLPKGLLPAELTAGGSVPFSVEVKKASPTQVTLSADAAGAELRFGDLFAKARGRKAAFKLVARLLESGAIDVPDAAVELDGAQFKVNGEFSSDLATFVCRKLTAEVKDPAALATLAPMLKEFKLGGSAGCELSGKVPIKEVLSGKLGGVDFGGQITLRDVRAWHAQAPKLTLGVSGSVRLSRDAIDAGGLTVTAKSADATEETRLTFKELRVTAAAKDAPLLSQPDALHLIFSVTSPQVNAGALLAALPKKTGEEPAPGPAATEPQLDLGFLKKHEATGRVEVGKVIYGKHVVNNIAGDFRLAENKLTTPNAIRAKVHDGTVEANLNADLGAPGIAHEGTVAIKAVDINGVASAALSLDDVFQGRVGGSLTWSGKGFSARDLSTNWSGDVAFVIEDGVVLNFERSPLIGGLAGPVLQHLGATAFPDNKFRYEKLNLKAHLDKGWVTARNLVLKGWNGLDVVIPKGSVNMDGRLDGEVVIKAPTDLLMEYIGRKIVKQKAALAVVREAAEKDPPPFCSFGVGGTFAKPALSLSLDPAALPKWALGVVAKSLRDPRKIIEGLRRDREEEKAERKDKPKEEMTEEERKRQEKKEEKEKKRDQRKKAVEDLLKDIFK